jgi:hypothetical protein
MEAAGKSQQEAVAAKPTAGLDRIWAKGMIDGDPFTTLIHATL